MGSPMDQLRELEPILCLAVFQPAQLQHRSVNNGRLLPLVEGGRSHLRPSQRMSAVFLSATGGDNPSAYDLDKERERHPSRFVARGVGEKGGVLIRIGPHNVWFLRLGGMAPNSAWHLRFFTTCFPRRQTGCCCGVCGGPRWTD